MVTILELLKLIIQYRVLVHTYLGNQLSFRKEDSEFFLAVATIKTELLEVSSLAFEEKRKSDILILVAVSNVILRKYFKVQSFHADAVL